MKQTFFQYKVRGTHIPTDTEEQTGAYLDNFFSTNLGFFSCPCYTKDKLKNRKAKVSRVVRDAYRI